MLVGIIQSVVECLLLQDLPQNKSTFKGTVQGNIHSFHVCLICYSALIFSLLHKPKNPERTYMVFKKMSVMSISIDALGLPLCLNSISTAHLVQRTKHHTQLSFVHRELLA